MTPVESHFTATVNVPADEVIRELRERLVRRWEPAKCESLDDGIAVQGEWWYRGEYHVTPTADGGSRVVHEVINVAPAGTRWLVPITVRSRSEEHRRGFIELLRTIGEVRETDRARPAGGVGDATSNMLWSWVERSRGRVGASGRW